MGLHWANLKEQDQSVFRATTAFLDGRLEERATVDWALRLKPSDTVKRMTLLNLIDSPYGRKLSEPWRSAWRLIEESWNNPTVENHASVGAYNIQHRLRAGDRSGLLVTEIVELVAPQLKVEPFSDFHLLYQKPPKRPKKVKDLFSIRLTSGRMVDPNVLELGDLTDESFLFSLALGLDAAVSNGIDIARRIGWSMEQPMWHLGQLHRVYYVPASERSDGEHEPDEFHQGIAPSVKLLHVVVSRLVDVDISAAIGFVQRWKLVESPVHMRLWAALSRDSRVTPADEVGTFLVSIDEKCFWDLHDYPEISELRARRFSELDSPVQQTLIDRIKRRPPRNQWPRKADADRVQSARLYWAVRELRRIEISGVDLQKRDKEWLYANLDEFPDLLQMERIDEGFLATTKARAVQPRPDGRYDLLVGEERLKALETGLHSARGGWDDDLTEGAADWIRQKGNQLHIIADLETMPDGGAAFPSVWERLCWVHSPLVGHDEDAAQHELSVEGARVLSLLDKLPQQTAQQAVDGISHWLSTWEKWFTALPEGLNVWRKIWPIAVKATDEKQPVEVEAEPNMVMQSSDDSESMAVDTLNTPTGKLVGVFLAACPSIQGGDLPFETNDTLRAMRDTIIATTGRSGLIVRLRMIESLPYFLSADPDWTREYLIAPLIADDVEAIALWRAIARQTHFVKVLEIIGGPMAERATDRRLDRETRRSLVFSLVIECLYAFLDQRNPAVPYTRIQQMIRSLDDEVRAYGAEAIQRFLRDVSAPNKDRLEAPSPETLFQSAVAPFLQQVWPQERSLATPGVSRALAKLPATARGAFADAVVAIKRFLVPFDCWSMLEYGLYGDEDGEAKLSIIDSQEKARAFIRLLDLTIGTAEASVIPNDLSDALDQVRKVSPDLTETQLFRRLAAAARR